jgi:Tol biopolymer transport system component
VFFSRGNNASASILVSHRQGLHWSKPTLAPFSGSWCDMEPSVSPDGTYLIFVSNRPAKAGDAVLDGRWSNKDHPGLGGNLWRVEIKASGYGEPVRLPDQVNLGSSVFAPAIFADGSLLFMSPDAQTNRFQLWRSAFTGGAYQPAERVPFAQRDATECDAAVSADGSFVVFSSTRPPAFSSRARAGARRFTSAPR